VSRFTHDDYRAALLMIGAPTPRYHRRRGSTPEQVDLDAIEARVLWRTVCLCFLVQRFGSIAEHGSFLTHFCEGYESWYNEQVTHVCERREHGK